eukprot:1055941-Pelagomonas_calceolata.AAC.1
MQVHTGGTNCSSFRSVHSQLPPHPQLPDAWARYAMPLLGSRKLSINAGTCTQMAVTFVFQPKQAAPML